MSKLRASVVVAGRVQGVAFRMAAQIEAQRLGVAGWVQNLPNGEVAARFEGETPAVEAMIAWCRRGPPAARVERVTVTREAPDPGEKHPLQDFKIVY